MHWSADVQLEPDARPHAISVPMALQGSPSAHWDDAVQPELTGATHRPAAQVMPYETLPQQSAAVVHVAPS